MFKKIKRYLTTRLCENCRERKPIKEINYFSMGYRVGENRCEQICEDCIKE